MFSGASNVGRKIAVRFLFLIGYTLFAPSSSFANEDQPVTAFQFKLLPFHLDKVGKVESELDCKGAELAAYYMLACLDTNRVTDDSDFKRALQYYCAVSNKYANTLLNSEVLLKDNALLRHQLELSLPGQRYLRFPRITWDDKRRNILLRYPQPELYGLSQSVKKITPQSSTYLSYKRELSESSISPGQELVLISHRLS